MKIHLATDHAGFAHKEFLKEYLSTQPLLEVVDHGAMEYIADDDYPDYILPCAQAVAEDQQDSLGVIFGGSGQGEAMCANRFRGVRAVVYYGGPTDILTLSRAHNGANILSIGARFLTPEETVEAFAIWIEAVYSHDERHTRRLSKF